MPEAKLLNETAGMDHQPSVGNFFSMSVGFGITVAVGLLYSLIFRGN